MTIFEQKEAILEDLNSMNIQLLISCILLGSLSHGFSPLPSVALRRFTNSNRRSIRMKAGFGGPKNDKKKKDKELKLKPKQQWDRYTNLKKATMVRVAVRVEGEEDAEWLEVGRVRSKDDNYTEIAVARQRVLIAEHARRLFPLQVLKDSKVEWAFCLEEPEDQWKVVDKSVLEGAPDGIEKEIGFEGRPDPATGFYCMYNEGRLIDSSFEGKV